MRLALLLALGVGLGCGARGGAWTATGEDAGKHDGAPPSPDTRERDGAPPPDDEPPPPKTPIGPAVVTPVSASCNASCPTLEPVGPLVELLPPHEESMGQTSVTFAADRWYVAWGGRPANVTQVQRLTRDGQLDGPALRIEGTTPGTLRPSAAGDGLVLLGWIPPAYTAAGRMMSVHWLGLDLAPARPAVLLRQPGTVIHGHLAQPGAGGELIVTDLLARPGALVREVRIPSAQSAPGVLSQRDWRPGEANLVAAIDRIDGRPFLLDVAGGALRARPLLDDGTIGAAASVFEIPAGEPRQIISSRRVGDRWWVAAWPAQNGTTVRLRALDPRTGTATSETITLKWPAGMPAALVDAHGTPALLGHVGGPGASLVPVDVTARAACTPNTVFIHELRGQSQTLRDVHFEGNTAGVTLDGWSTGPRRVYFTRLRCAPKG